MIDLAVLTPLERLKRFFLRGAYRRAGESVLDVTRKVVVSLAILLFVSTTSLVAQSDAGVSGTIRDLHGKPQMGVMVELLGSATTATALTDLEGHYQIRNIIPGVYQLRATAALYLPSLRRQVRLQARMRPVVNLTMSGLFDQTGWIFASRPDGLREGDDWNWTLRSPANKPMLRLVGDDVPCTLSNLEQAQKRAETHGALTTKSSEGGFGSLGTGVGLAFTHRSGDEKKVIRFHSFATKTKETEGGLSQTPFSSSILLQSASGIAGTNRVSVRLRTFPQIQSAKGDPLSAAEFGSAERVQMEDFAALEVGSETQLLRAGSSALLTYPFLRVTSQPIAGWTTAYAFATSSDLSHYEDVGKEERAVPTVIRSEQGLLTEKNFHQEVIARRKFSRASLQLVYEHDAVKRAALSGKLFKRQSSPLPYKLSSGTTRDIVLDHGDNAFRMLAPGFSNNGLGIAMDLPITDSVTISGGYLSGTGIVLQSNLLDAGDNRFPTRRSSAFLASVKGHVIKSGTRVSVTYRWQPADRLNTISPYQMPEVEPYLGVYLRQALPITRGLPAGVEVSVDGANLLGEGDQRFALAQQKAFLASALRELRVGLSFTF